MEPTKELGDAIYREKVQRARATPPEEKVLDGPRLFDWAIEWMKAGIRMQYPDADEERVRALVWERLEIGRRLEQGS
jgi:hypothetical protein